MAALASLALLSQLAVQNSLPKLMLTAALPRSSKKRSKALTISELEIG